MSRLVGPVLDAGDDGIIGFVFVKFPSHSLSPNTMGAFLLRDSAGKRFHVDSSRIAGHLCPEYV